jgi:hypothetical protein
VRSATISITTTIAIGTAHALARFSIGYPHYLLLILGAWKLPCRAFRG